MQAARLPKAQQQATPSQTPANAASHRGEHHLPASSVDELQAGCACQAQWPPDVAGFKEEGADARKCKWYPAVVRSRRGRTLALDYADGGTHSSVPMSLVRLAPVPKPVRKGERTSRRVRGEEVEAIEPDPILPHEPDPILPQQSPPPRAEPEPVAMPCPDATPGSLAPAQTSAASPASPAFPCSACGEGKRAKLARCGSTACVARRVAVQQQRDAALAARERAAEALFVAPRADAAANAAALDALRTLAAPLTQRGKQWPQHVIELPPAVVSQPEELEPEPKRSRPAAASAAATAPMEVEPTRVTHEEDAGPAAAKSDYELQRDDKIARNQQMLVELGILDAKTTLAASSAAAAAAGRKRQQRKLNQPAAGPSRRSSRSSAATGPNEPSDVVTEPPPTGHFVWVRFKVAAGVSEWHRALVIKRTREKSVTCAANGLAVTETRPATAIVQFDSDGSTETITFPEASGELVVEERPPRGSLIEKLARTKQTQAGCGEIRRSITHIQGWDVKAALRYVPPSRVSRPSSAAGAAGGGDTDDADSEEEEGEAARRHRASIRYNRSDLFPVREERWVALAQCTPTAQQEQQAGTPRAAAAAAAPTAEMVPLAMTVTWLSPTAVSFHIEKPSTSVAAVTHQAAAADAPTAAAPMDTSTTSEGGPGERDSMDSHSIDASGSASSAAAAAASPAAAASAAAAVTAAEASVSSLQPLRSEMSINIPPGGGAAGGGGRDICIVDGKVAEACAAANSPHEIACITLWCWATFPAMTTWTVLPGSNRGSSPAAVGFQHNRVDGGWIMQHLPPPQ